MTLRKLRFPPVGAGMIGGAIAGVLDVVFALEGLTPDRAGRLLVLGLGIGGVAGGLLQWLLAGLTVLLRRLPRLASGERAPIAAFVTLAAPLLIYDAFAAFGGSRASRIPGRQAISAVLALLGALALVFLARLVLSYLRSLEAGRRSRVVGLGLAAALVGMGVGLQVANREVLPRLYPWFHTTLSVLGLAVLVLAARVASAGRSAPVSVRRLGLVAVLGSAVVGALLVRQSQTLLFVAHERTQMTGPLMGAVLSPPRARPVAVAKRVRAEDQTPLPPGPQRPDADIVLITIDALRADHLGVYGYHRPTTPNIDALARRGVRFERAYAQAPHTSFSVASMLTGKYYPTLARLSPGDPHDPVAQVLRRYGWKTAAFYPPAVFFVDADKLKAYQDNNFQFEYVKVEFMDAHARLSQIAAFFEQEQPRKSFLWVHFFEPHEAYDRWPQHDFGNTDIDRYDSEIAYTDAAVGRLLAYLEKNRPNSIVILTADHGEEFDEHGSRYHGSTLYEEQIRVPLIIAVPGVEPHVVSGPVELIDIAPTILGMLDIPIPVRMRGTDLGPWLANPPAPASRLAPAFAEVGDKRMVVEGTEKLICDLNWGACEYYDLKADPGEKNKFGADERPERVAELRARLDDWLDDHLRFEPQLLKGLANPGGEAIPKAIERGRLSDLSYVGDLARMLTSSEPLRVRLEAARLLVTHLPPRPETREAIVAALAALPAAEGEVRDWSAIAAARLGEPSALDRLRKIVVDDGESASTKDVRLYAALALSRAKRPDPAGVPVLAAALSTECGNVLLCRHILLAIETLKDARAVPALLARLGEVQNRRETVEALAAIADPGSTEALTERLRRDEYVPVRSAAAKALANIAIEHPGSAKDIQEALAEAAEAEREPVVAKAVRAALDNLRPAD